MYSRGGVAEIDDVLCTKHDFPPAGKEFGVRLDGCRSAVEHAYIVLSNATADDDPHALHRTVDAFSGFCAWRASPDSSCQPSVAICASLREGTSAPSDV
jgi:hypothetical protein